MQYMLLIYDDLDAVPAEGSPEDQAEFAAWMEHSEAMERAGVLAGGAPLELPDAAVTVRVRDGETLVIDGPFAETKEQLGGYAVAEVADLAGAIEWATSMPHIARGSVEIRPVMQVTADA